MRSVVPVVGLGIVGVLGLGIVAACVGDDPVPVAAPSDGAAPANDANGGGPNDSSVGPGTDAADGGGGGDAADAHVATFCEGKPKPVGVSDYLCADFDVGPLDAGFSDVFLTAGGTLALATDVAASPPRSLLAATSPSEAAIQDRGGALEWTVTGAANVKTVSITAKINPNVDPTAFAPSPGTIELVGFEIAGVSTVSLRYQDRVVTNGDLPANYVGYYLHNQLYAGGVAHKPIAPALPSAVWTTVKLDVNFTANTATLSQNGVAILTNVVSAAQPTSSLKFTLGSKRRGGTVARPAPHRFDDVMIEVTRQ